MMGSYEQRADQSPSTSPFSVQRHEEEEGQGVQAHSEGDAGGDDVQAKAATGAAPVQAKVAPLMSHWADDAGPAPRSVQRHEEEGDVQQHEEEGDVQGKEAVQMDGGEGEDVQHKAGKGSTASVHAAAKAGTSGSAGSLPYMDQIQKSFGPKYDVSGLQSFQGPATDKAATQMKADAYAVGNKVAFKGTPSLHTAAHEAAHTIQQKAGAVQLAGGVGKAGDKYEQHADAVADRVVQGKPAGDLLDQMAGQGGKTGAVQKQEEEGDVQGKEAVQLHEDEEAVQGQGAVQMNRGRLPKKAVSGKAFKRLADAREAINHTKQVLAFGAGNQADALRATNFNSYFRLKVMRDPACWEIAPSVRRIASQDPAALTAAKADLAQGGNCGEHAIVAFDYLRAKGTGDPLAVAAKSGLDHAFVLIGDVSEPDQEIVVSDPWPTMATATTWGDHFAYTGDRAKIERSYTGVSDGSNAKEVIKAGLKLSAKGKQMIQASLSKQETEKTIDRDMGGWIWGHEDAAATGKKYDYVQQPSRPGGTGSTTAGGRR